MSDSELVWEDTDDDFATSTGGDGMTFYGMNTEQGETFAQTIGDRKQALEDCANRLNGIISGIDSFWRGPDAENFRGEWEGLRGGPFQQAAERLWDFARELSDHAQEQDVTSAEGVGKLGEMLKDIFSFDGDPWGILTGPFTAFGDWKNWLTGLAGVPGALSKEMLKHANQIEIFAHRGEKGIVPWLKNAYKLKGIAKALGPVGNIATGLFAGVDRWNQDAGDPSLSTLERGTRSLLDGGANVAGGIAGGAAGAKGGAMAGAAIGSVIPGAGTAVGAAVGGAIGALAGSIAGSGAANGIIDWALG